jgi:hypothetical protein
MKIEMFDKIQLKNGKAAHVVEIFEQGSTYAADIDEGDGEYTTDMIKHSDILCVFAEPVEDRRAI